MTNIEVFESGCEFPLTELAGILHASVHQGASVGFVLPFSIDDAAAFWSERVLPGVKAGERVLLLASINGRVVATAQVIWAPYPNQSHRADVAKLLVHPEARRRGLARALMLAAEDVVRRGGRSLITLDTRTGDDAEPLYVSLGYQTAGIIPGYAIAPEGGRLDATTVMYKQLR